MKTWQKATFIIVLVAFVTVSVVISFYSMARAPFEYEYRTDIGGIKGNDGWVLFGFNGNMNTKEVYIDYVRDENGNNPDESKPVVAVGEFTMNTDEYVEKIYIGKDVRYIDETSFFYCKELKSFEVDDANEYYTDVDGVLYTKDMKTLVSYPNKLNDFGEEEPPETVSYVIPDSVERIASCAFYKNEVLTEINLPSTLKEIGNMTFFKCERMEKIELPDGLEKIGDDAFSFCSALKHVIFIPESVKTIGNYAFYNCTQLKEFYMGAKDSSQMTLGEGWLPKNISKVVINVSTEEQYGKTREEAVARFNELNKGGES